MASLSRRPILRLALNMAVLSPGGISSVLAGQPDGANPGGGTLFPTGRLVCPGQQKLRGPVTTDTLQYLAYYMRRHWVPYMWLFRRNTFLAQGRTNARPMSRRRTRGRK